MTVSQIKCGVSFYKDPVLEMVSKICKAYSLIGNNI